MPAVAVFVKTPGLSPVKTRLAATLGAPRAEQFYRLSVECVRSAVRSFCDSSGAIPCWAVAEPEGLGAECWRDFSRVPQGVGSLGERLSRVYDALLDSGPVLFLGADTPQLAPADLQAALDGLERRPFVLGRCPDGGFHLFGGRVPLPRETWDISWSTRHTADELLSRLEPHGPVAMLRELCDVDIEADLLELECALALLKVPTLDQIRLREWLLNRASSAGVLTRGCMDKA